MIHIIAAAFVFVVLLWVFLWGLLPTVVLVVLLWVFLWSLLPTVARIRQARLECKEARRQLEKAYDNARRERNDPRAPEDPGTTST